MNEWTQLQQDFQNYLHLGHATIEKAIVDTELVSAQMRLQVYRNAYQARLEEALASNWGLIEQITILAGMSLTL